MYQTITAETTNEQIVEKLFVAKRAMFEFATTEMESAYANGARFVSMAQNVRSTQALVEAQIGFRDVLAGNKPEAAVYYLLEICARSEDRSSGRDNDSIRACQDAIRGWASEAARELRYGV